MHTRTSDRDGRPTYAYETLQAGVSVDVGRDPVINDSSHAPSVLTNETRAVTAVDTHGQTLALLIEFTGFGQLLEDSIVIPYRVILMPGRVDSISGKKTAGGHARSDQSKPCPTIPSTVLPISPICHVHQMRLTAKS
jgi:hypothetical protein